MPIPIDPAVYARITAAHARGLYPCVYAPSGRHVFGRDNDPYLGFRACLHCAALTGDLDAWARSFVPTGGPRRADR